MGRWVDRATKRMVTLDPASLPADPGEPAAAPAEAPAAPQEGPARELESAPLPPVPPVPPRDPGASVGSAGSSSGVSSAGPSVPSSGASSDFSGIPSLDSPGTDPQALPPHDPECWRGSQEGRPCPRCQTAIYGRLPPEELNAFVGFHELMINRVTPYPRPFSASERASAEAAGQMLAVRYGNPMAEYAPLLLAVAATWGPIQERRQPPELPGGPVDGGQS